MIYAAIEPTFEAWRREARRLLARQVSPSEVVWTDQDQTPLLPLSVEGDVGQPGGGASRVSKAFIGSAAVVACHREPGRWPLLYRMLWRQTHGESHLLELVTDDDVRQFFLMEKSVRRDRHKMTAFVRFRKVMRDGDEHYVAWYKPDHHIVRLTAGHFRERFRAMRWSILTSDECAHWDGAELTFTPGVTRDAAPGNDELEALWLTYYGSIFNPARINIGMMKKEMPVRFWSDLPEAHIIPDLLKQAPERVADMIARSASLSKEAQQTAIPETSSLAVLKEAANACTLCPLYKHAHQTVFGEGPTSADVVFVGEQPGDREDIAGKPFIGPAGQLFDEVLHQVGIDRSRVYVTNAVKHFKFEQRGERRIHAKPSAREIAACHVWIKKELEIIKPKALVLLGATAAQSLVGRQFKITQQRGTSFASDWANWTLATWHPSALLRSPDEESRKKMREQFASDLRQVAEQIGR